MCTLKFNVTLCRRLLSRTKERLQLNAHDPRSFWHGLSSSEKDLLKKRKKTARIIHIRFNPQFKLRQEFIESSIEVTSV